MERPCEKPAREARNPHGPPRDDRALAELARRQHAVLAIWQLGALRLTADAVRKRVKAGRLHRVHTGVYSVVHPSLLTRLGRFMAAVLACGEHAVLSHHAAAALYALRLRAGAPIDVTAPGARGRDRRGIRAHSARTLAAQDVTVVEGIPCTTLARTLLDVAGTAARRDLERALDQAEQQRLLDIGAIDAVLSRAAGRRGARLLHDVVSEHRAGSTLTRSGLEEAFLAVCRGAGIAPDGVNAWIPFPDGGGAEADFLWRARDLVAEVDGRTVHATRRAFETDRRRDQRLATLGYRVVRFTWRQVVNEPAHVAATLRALLV